MAKKLTLNPTSGELDVVDVDLYTNATAVPTTIGGIESGTTFSNQTMTQMWDALLYPYQEPAFSAFAMSGQSTSLEVGATVTGSSRTFTWTTTNSSNVSSNSIVIRDVTGNPTPNTDLGTGLANDSSESLNIGSAITKTTNTTHVWQARGVDTQATTFTRNLTVTWSWRRYHGTSASTTLNEAGIEGLTSSSLTSTIATTYTFSAGDYKYICYPSSLGTLTTFTDTSTSLSVPFETVYTVSVTNTNAVTTNYNVHRSTNILGSAISIAAT